MSAHALPYPVYPDVCGWNALLPPRASRPAARGSMSCRYAVVGAGYTGVAVARRLSELDPDADIVMLDATTVGEGSAGRNSGFIGPRDIAGGLSARDIATAEARNRYGAEGFDWLVALMQQHRIDCDLQLSGRIKGAATAHGEARVNDMLAVVRAHGVPHVLLDREQLRERVGSAYYRCGLFTEWGYLVQPAALIRGLADALPKSVQLFENSPVLELNRRGKWHLTTPEAEITADIVVMATNAAIKHFGYLRDRLVTIFTYAGITPALTSAERQYLGSMPVWGILPSHRLGTTVRRIGADRLMVRSLYSYERGIAPAEAQRALLDRFYRRYPDLRHIDLEYVWGGTTALTMNGSPYWGRVDDGLYTSAGCNGAGVVKGTVLGKRLAEHIMGHDVEDDLRRTYGTASWIAPEPFRSAGFRVVSALERRKAGLES